MNSTTSRPKKSNSSKKNKAVGAVPASHRQRRRAKLPAAIPLEKIRPEWRSEPRLERETPLLARVCAERVCAQAASLLDSEAPMAFEARLARRARHLYAVNIPFNHRLRGSNCREWLYAFMRHWLAGWLARTTPALAHALPEDFTRGA